MKSSAATANCEVDVAFIASSSSPGAAAAAAGGGGGGGGGVCPSTGLTAAAGAAPVVVSIDVSVNREEKDNGAFPRIASHVICVAPK